MIALLLVGVLIMSVLAYHQKKLTLDGAITAFFVGALISLTLGLFGLLLLALFFVTSSSLSFFKIEKKVNEVTKKGARRDAWQVVANSGVATVCALLYGIMQEPVFVCGFIASLAAANADTWASEIGPLSRKKPLHLITWKRVEPGTSGAVSALGSAAAFAGAFIIVVFGVIFWGGSFFGSHYLLLFLTFAGFIGCLFDTVAGATGQVVYQCQQCKIETERTEHCERETVQIYGVSWMNNDVVNLICTLTGALAGLLAGSFIV